MDMKMLDYLYRNCPDSVFLKAINLNRILNGRDRVRYDHESKGCWVIHYPGFDLHVPGPRWIYSGLDHFSNRFEKFFKIMPGDICVDIGACIGDTSMPMIVKTGESGKVFAFEPLPSNLNFLELNLKGYSNVKIIPKAIADKDGSLTFYLHSVPTGHSLVPLSEDGVGEIKVDCISLDSVLDIVGGKVDFCKLDVQGFEIDILKATHKFFDNVDKFVIGVHDLYTENRTDLGVLDILNKYGGFDFVKFGWDSGAGYVYAAKKGV